jgi:cell division protein FtsW
MSSISSGRKPHSEILAPPDKGVLTIVTFLVAIGLLLVFDASFLWAADIKNDIYFMLRKQAFFAVIGIAVMFSVARMDLSLIRRYSNYALTLAVILLVGVLIPGIGHKVQGAQAWYKLWIFTLQPSELAKFLLMIYLAGALAAPNIFTRGVRSEYWIYPAGACALIVTLIVAERDAGTAAIITGAGIVVFFAAGAKKISLLLFVLVLVMGSGLFLSSGLSKVGPFKHIGQRLEAYKDPWNDPQGVGYHTVQSLIALGSGGLGGVGLCEGRGKMFIPEAPTDYVAATLGEELGFLGIGALLLLFGILTYKGLNIAGRCRSNFGSLLATGITSVIAVQTLVNLGVVCNAIPSTGVTLPFISYGGSSLLSSCFGIGLLISVSRHINSNIRENNADECSNKRRRHRRPYLPRR